MEVLSTIILNLCNVATIRRTSLLTGYYIAFSKNAINLQRSKIEINLVESRSKYIYAFVDKQKSTKTNVCVAWVYKQITQCFHRKIIIFLPN